VVWVSLALALAAWLQLRVQLSMADPPWWGRAVFFSTLFLGPLYLAVRVGLMPSVEFHDSVLRVRNIYVTLDVPYAMIDGVGGRLGIVLEVRGRPDLPVRAFDPSPFGLGRTEAVREEVRRRAGSAGAVPGAEFRRQYTFGFLEAVPVLVAGLLLAVRAFAS